MSLPQPRRTIVQTLTHWLLHVSFGLYLFLLTLLYATGTVRTLMDDPSRLPEVLATGAVLALLWLALMLGSHALT